LVDVKRETQHGRRTAQAVASVLAALVIGWSAPEPVRDLPGAAARFVGYLSVVEAGGERMTVWDRVVYSLVLAGEKKRLNS
jgi:hypothetical protein